MRQVTDRVRQMVVTQLDTLQEIDRDLVRPVLCKVAPAHVLLAEIFHLAWFDLSVFDGLRTQNGGRRKIS